MKRRIIRATEANASKPYPEAYIKLQKSLQDLRHLIDECVDEGLEDYAAWDEISQGLFSGIQAISKACRDLDTSSAAVQSSTQPVLAGQYEGYSKFIQFDGVFAEIPNDCWYLVVRIPLADYRSIPEDVKDLMADYGMPRGEDEEGYLYIDVEDRIKGADSEHINIFKQHDICPDSKKYQVVAYTEVW